MAKINEEMFEDATKTAGLKSNIEASKSNTQRYVAVYDVPKVWIEAVKRNGGIKTMSAFARQAILEKLERDGLI